MQSEGIEDKGTREGDEWGELLSRELMGRAQSGTKPDLEEVRRYLQQPAEECMLTSPDFIAPQLRAFQERGFERVNRVAGWGDCESEANSQGRSQTSKGCGGISSRARRDSRR